jgi:hypothetical protein
MKERKNQSSIAGLIIIAVIAIGLYFFFSTSGSQTEEENQDNQNPLAGVENSQEAQTEEVQTETDQPQEVEERNTLESMSEGERKTVYRDMLLASKIATRESSRAGDPQGLQFQLESKYNIEVQKHYKITDERTPKSILMEGTENNWALEIDELGNDSILFDPKDNCLDQHELIMEKLKCFD